MDILGDALLDYQTGNYVMDIDTFLNFSDQFEEEKDTLPLPYLFRNYEQMPLLEKEALLLCSGNVLDIGCGAGSHSLYLQEKGLSVTALDSSLGAIKTCELRGVENRVHANILDFKHQSFDTLLLLMNGIGIAGTIEGLNMLFDHLRTILNPGGQVILDSSDIIYMFDTDEDGGYWLPFDGSYYGEVKFRMTYKKKNTETFNWLYIDYSRLQEIAHTHHFNCELVSQGEHYDYLSRITFK